MPPQRTCRISLAVCFAMGALLMIIAVLLVPALPHFQLDRVLTFEELVDPATREATLTLLKKAQGNSYLALFLAGAIVAVAAGVGLFALRSDAKNQ